MPIRVVQFFAIVSLALYLVPSGAHLMALPNKMGLDDPSYLVVQQIYRGWALAGVVLAVALAATLALVILSRRQRLAFALALVGLVALAAAALVFFVWVFPANRATENWTNAGPDLPSLRRHWEFGHAGAAVLVLQALLATVAASLVWRDEAKA